MRGTSGVKGAFIGLAIGVLLLALMNMLTYFYVKNLSSTVESYSRVNEKVDELAKRVAEIEDSYAALTSIVSRVNASVGELMDRVASVEQRISSIQRMRENTSSLQLVLRRLNDLRRELSELRAEYSMLEQEVESLKASMNPSGTAQHLSGDRYRELVVSVQPWYFYFAYTLQLSDAVKRILSIAESQEEVKELVTTIGIDPDESLETKIWKVINYTSLHLMYMNDTYVRVPTLGGSVRVWSDAIQLPNETVANGGGDCEDLALLVYSILKHVAKPGEEVYLLMLKPASGEGHTIVMVIDRNSKRLYLIDPAMSFVNGYALVLEMNLMTWNGSSVLYVRRWLDPMLMSPRLKHQMLRDHEIRIAFVDMFHLSERKVYYEPRTYDLPPRQLLEEYLEITGMNPARYIVVSSNFLREFPGTEFLLQWINERLYS